MRHRKILFCVSAALLQLSTAAVADGQLGQRVLGSVGLDAGSQPDEGVYAGDRFFYFSADQLRDRQGDLVPVKGLEIGAYANVIGLSGTLKPEGLPYLSAAFAVPVAGMSTKADLPPTDVAAFGLGDIFVQPLMVGWRSPFDNERAFRLSALASYNLYHQKIGIDIARGAPCSCKADSGDDCFR